MQERDFNEKDWTLFRSKIVNWQEAYMGKLNKEYIQLLNGDANASEKFWSLDKRINEDKKKAGVRLEMNRSNFVHNIVCLINEGVIGVEDISEFSDELKKSVINFIEM